MKTIITFTIAFLLSLMGHSQQSSQKIEMKLDEIGNAKLNISMNMNASQWQQWNGTYGANPSALKRDMERSMPAFIVDDFKLEKDDMNRSFNLSLNAYGVCKIDKRGRWIMDTDKKDVQLTELTDRKYMIVASPPEFGGTLQQTTIIEFPDTANNIKVDKDSFGKTIFEFKMDNPSSSFNLIRWSGLLLMILGGAWFGKNAMQKA
ncbi:hypothetical protein [Psychroserpens sp. Hel_I_66]|uniref:hypothetical protein n=1 Tax=Psychroserpens sp. Hel_I_66 TaxID=1250004 RepID=UPI0012E03D73|nr:hypothetical protein [Psychroserpens sp. Hel_I_66]